MMTLAQAHELLPASRLVGDGATPIARVHTDSRTLRDGDLFVALRGERFDGHDYLAAARVAGAAAAIAERGLEQAALPGLLVDDALAALQQLAAAWRQRMQLPLAAVTGSNGKTTVTQMTAAMLNAWQGECAFATHGNLNNHIGVPLTLLRLRQDEALTHRVAVVELGMNQPGEVALLARLAAPTVALVNNAGREHQEFMHTVESAARENGSVIDALPPSGVVVIPADDSYTPLWQQMAGARRVLRFVLEPSATAAEVSGRAEWQVDRWLIAARTPDGDVELTLRMPGRHNAKNALAAAACALALGAPLDALAAGLAHFSPVPGRSALRRLQRAGRLVTLVDDSYNANPDSVAAAIAVLAELPGPRWLVLGDMGEVGEQGPQFHREAGALARGCGIDALWCVGPASAETAKAYGAGARHFEAVPALISELGDAPAAAAILVKGSRFMAMERVVRAIVESFGDEAVDGADAGGAHAA